MNGYWIYRHYDAAAALLYVGMTKNPESRPYVKYGREHWIDDSARVEVDGPYPLDEAAALERKAIRDEAPLHNVYRNNGNLKAAERAAAAMTDEEHHAWDRRCAEIISDFLSERAA